jgi:hypothetical protein
VCQTTRAGQSGKTCTDNEHVWSSRHCGLLGWAIALHNRSLKEGVHLDQPTGADLQPDLAYRR